MAIALYENFVLENKMTDLMVLINSKCSMYCMDALTKSIWRGVSDG